MIKRNVIVIAMVLVVHGCDASSPPGSISDVYVADFQSADMRTCRPSDVALGNNDVAQFFSRGRSVEYRVIHDHYPVAPCYIEGTLRRAGMTCEWRVYAGATGQITCDGQTQYWVCDECGDLFRKPR